MSLTSIFDTYDRNTGEKLLQFPGGKTVIPIEYSHDLFDVIPAVPLIETSTVHHPTRFPITIQSPLLLHSDILGDYNQPFDLYIESNPEFVKDYNLELKSNLQLDLEEVVYTDGMRLESQQIQLLQSQRPLGAMVEPVAEAVEKIEPPTEVVKEEEEEVAKPMLDPRSQKLLNKILDLAPGGKKSGGKFKPEEPDNDEKSFAPSINDSLSALKILTGENARLTKEEVPPDLKMNAKQQNKYAYLFIREDTDTSAEANLLLRRAGVSESLFKGTKRAKADLEDFLLEHISGSGTRLDRPVNKRTSKK
jgi:hypothetical protein